MVSTIIAEDDAKKKGSKPVYGKYENLTKEQKSRITKCVMESESFQMNSQVIHSRKAS